MTSIPDLAQLFTELARRYSTDEVLIDGLWAEISQAYSGPKRHYHTLVHLAALVTELQPHQAKIAAWDDLLFSVFYHDIVYDAVRSDNEEKSADLAVARLGRLGVPTARIEHCQAQILATKRHEASGDPDTDLLTDADLAILGQPWPSYQVYAQQVRAEYKIYPDLLYKPGRKKVLRHFLDKVRIYKTAPFFERYEMAARANLTQELAAL
jgi:predicted metal-dependent HD superfamily phosphohydrolase